MGAANLAQYEYEAFDDKYGQIMKYLSTEGDYWKDNDRWYMDADSFVEVGITASNQRHWLLADFSSYKKERLKDEMKYFLLRSMKDGIIDPISIYKRYRRAIPNMGKLLSAISGIESFDGLNTCDRELEDARLKSTEKRVYLELKHGVTRLITDYYGNYDEMGKNVWRAIRIPGAKVSAADKYQKPSMSFVKLHPCYREMVKRFMRRLVIKRSWSYCTETLVYIKYFFQA